MPFLASLLENTGKLMSARKVKLNALGDILCFAGPGFLKLKYLLPENL